MAGSPAGNLHDSMAHATASAVSTERRQALQELSDMADDVAVALAECVDALSSGQPEAAEVAGALLRSRCAEIAADLAQLSDLPGPRLAPGVVRMRALPDLPVPPPRQPGAADYWLAQLGDAAESIADGVEAWLMDYTAGDHPGWETMGSRLLLWWEEACREWEAGLESEWADIAGHLRRRHAALVLQRGVGPEAPTGGVGTSGITAAR